MSGTGTQLILVVKNAEKCANRSREQTGFNAHRRREDTYMPEKQTLQRARRDRREGKAPSTQAGEFIREQSHREGKHGARSTKQAIAIGLSEARRAGVDLPPPAKGKTSEKTRKSAARAYALGHGAPPRRAPTPKRARAAARKAARTREMHAH